MLYKSLIIIIIIFTITLSGRLIAIFFDHPQTTFLTAFPLAWSTQNTIYWWKGWLYLRMFIWDKLSYLLLKWQNEHQWISTSFSTLLNTATFQYIISGWHAPTWFGQASVILAAQLRHCSQWWVYLRCLFVHSGVSEANAHFSEKLSCLSHLLWGGISTNDKCQV